MRAPTAWIAGESAAPDGRTARAVDVLVIGGGPAGLSAAAALRRLGVGQVEVLEREDDAGGIPRHSHHTGYGLRDLHRVMTGPAYARHYTDLAVSAGASVRTNTSATGWAGPLTVDVTSPAGLERISAGAVVLATGARERPRSARLVPGSRPAGVYTTGQQQQAVYLYHQPIGRRALVVGAEHVSYSAAVTLHHAGVRVAAMVTDLPHQQSYVAFRIGAGLRYRFPVLTDTAVVRLLGKPRLEAVELRRGNGTIETVAVDTVVFTGDWVPDHELARAGGVVLDDGSLGPVVDTTLRTSVPGVFAAGNVVHPVETADVVAIDGRYVAESVARWLSGDRPPASSARRLVVQEPLRWVAPGCVAPTAPRPPRNRFILWTAQFVHRPTFVVVQDGRVLQVQRHRTPLVPNRPAYLSAQWWGEVDPRGGDVSIAVA